MECLICLREYDSQEAIPMVLSCGHCTCIHCLLHLKILHGNIRCPICNKIDPRNPEEIPKNFLCLEQAQKINHLATEMQRTTHELLEEKFEVTQKEMIICEYLKTIEEQQQKINELNNNKNIIMQSPKLDQYLVFDRVANEGLSFDYVPLPDNISLYRRLFCNCSLNCSEICKKNSILFKFFFYYCIMFLPFVSI